MDNLSQSLAACVLRGERIECFSDDVRPGIILRRSCYVDGQKFGEQYAFDEFAINLASHANIDPIGLCLVKWSTRPLKAEAAKPPPERFLYDTL